MYAKLSQIYWFYLINMIDMTTNYSVILRNMSKQYFNLLLIVMGFVLCSNQCNIQSNFRYYICGWLLGGFVRRIGYFQS